jgi:hypothetical protein
LTTHGLLMYLISNDSLVTQHLTIEI